MTDSKVITGATRLDWSKLLGFDQVRLGDHTSLKLNDLKFSKIGAKSCTRPPA